MRDAQSLQGATTLHVLTRARDETQDPPIAAFFRLKTGEVVLMERIAGTSQGPATYLAVTTTPRRINLMAKGEMSFRALIEAGGEVVWMVDKRRGAPWEQPQRTHLLALPERWLPVRDTLFPSSEWDHPGELPMPEHNPIDGATPIHTLGYYDGILSQILRGADGALYHFTAYDMDNDWWHRLVSRVSQDNVDRLARGELSYRDFILSGDRFWRVLSDGDAFGPCEEYATFQNAVDSIGQTLVDCLPTPGFKHPSSMWHCYQESSSCGSPPPSESSPS